MMWPWSWWKRRQARKRARERAEKDFERQQVILDCRTFGHEWDLAKPFLNRGLLSHVCSRCGTVRSESATQIYYIAPDSPVYPPTPEDVSRAYQSKLRDH